MITRVLLVDDEAVTRQYIAQLRLWQQGEFALSGAARTGEEALERLAVGDIDILLMDVYMPGMNGVALSQQVAERFPQVSMVAVSNYDNYDYVREIMKNGAEDYLLKARLDENELAAVLRRARDRTGILPKQALRQKLAQWMRDEGTYPFPTDGSRLGAIVFAAARQEAASLSQEEIVVEGILRLLESMSSAEEDCVAIYLQDAHVVLFIRFYGTVSLAAIQARLDGLCREAAAAVQQVYHVVLSTGACMPMLDNKMLRSFILHRLQGEQEAATPRRASLTIAQQKQLLHLMEDRNIPATAALLREILLEAQREGTQAYIILYKELVDILAHAAAEYDITMPEHLQGLRLYRWMRINTAETQTEELVTAAKHVLHQALLHENTQYSPLVRDAMLHLRERFAQPIGLKEIAGALGCNASYLSRVFHQETGMTLIEHLTQVRIAEAKRLLTRKPLKQIAELVGFSQYTYFLKVFKQETGMTPKQYIRRQQAQK